MPTSFRLWHRYLPGNFVGVFILLFLLTGPSDAFIASSLAFLLFLLLFFDSHGSCGCLGQRDVLMVAGYDLSRQTLDRLDVVETQSCHLLTGLLNLLDAWRKVAEFALLSEYLVSVSDDNVRSG